MYRLLWFWLQVSNLSRDKDDLVRRLHQDNSGDIDRLHNLQKENTTLNQKVRVSNKIKILSNRDKDCPMVSIVISPEDVC